MAVASSSMLTTRAKEIAGRVRIVQVGVGVQQGLHGITARLELAQARDRIDRRPAVEHGRAAGREIVDIAAEYWRLILAGLADGEPGIT